LFVLRQAFRHGIRLNAAVVDVTEGIRRVKENRRNRFILPEEIDRLVAAARKGRAKYYLPAIICLGAEHGASRQEVLRLRWSDILFTYQGVGLISFFRTKNGRERTEFLMPRTRQELVAWKGHLERKRKKERIRRVETDAVFCRIDGTPLAEFKKAWQTALEDAGIKDFHFHDLRHTFCSNVILSGGGLKDAKEMIGHADISMTDRYAHLTALHKLERQKQLADHYGGGNGDGA
jgi:integrase